MGELGFKLRHSVSRACALNHCAMAGTKGIKHSLVPRGSVSTSLFHWQGFFRLFSQGVLSEPSDWELSNVYFSCPWTYMAGPEEGLLLVVFHRLGHHHWGVGVCYEFLLSQAERKRSGSPFQGTAVFEKDWPGNLAEGNLAGSYGGSDLSFCAFWLFGSFLAFQVQLNLPSLPPFFPSLSLDLTSARGPNQSLAPAS